MSNRTDLDEPEERALIRERDRYQTAFLQRRRDALMATEAAAERAKTPEEREDWLREAARIRKTL